MILETKVISKEGQPDFVKSPSAADLVETNEIGKEAVQIQAEEQPLKSVKDFLESNVGQTAWLAGLLSLTYFMLTITDRLLGMLVASAAITFSSIIVVELWDQLYLKPKSSKRLGLLKRLMALTLPFLVGYLHLRYRTVANNILYAEIGIAVMVILGILRAKKKFDQRLNTNVKHGRLRRLIRAFVICVTSTLFFPVAYGLNLLLDRIAPYSYWTGLVLTTIFIMCCLYIISSLLLEKAVPYIDHINQ